MNRLARKHRAMGSAQLATSTSDKIAASNAEMGSSGLGFVLDRKGTSLPEPTPAHAPSDDASKPKKKGLTKPTPLEPVVAAPSEGASKQKKQSATESVQAATSKGNKTAASNAEVTSSFVLDRKGASLTEPTPVEPVTTPSIDASKSKKQKKHKKPEQALSEPTHVEPVEPTVASSDDDSKPEKPNRPKKRGRNVWIEDEEANEETLDQLERAVFSRVEHFAEKLLTKSSKFVASDDEDDDSGQCSDEAHSPSVTNKEKPKQKTSAWVDDEEEEKRGANNRKQYERLVGQPSWAVKAEKRKKKAKRSKEDDGENGGGGSSSSTDDDEQDEAGFRKMRDYISNAVSSSASSDPSLAALPAGSLQFSRCADLNRELRHFAHVSAIDFYPLSTLALVASHDSTLNLFQVDGKANPLIHSIVMKQWPIQSALFSAHTQEIFMQCAVSQPDFYGYDLMSEKMTFYNRYRDQGCTPFRNMTLSPDGSLMAFSSRAGYVHIISTRTKELLFDLKRNCEVGGLAIVGNQLYAAGNDSEVFVWDIRQQRCCLNRFNDSGCIHGTKLVASPDSSLLACASDSGIINLYNLNSCSTERDPKPIKVFKNIVTPVSGLVMNHSSEMMVAWSSSAPRVVKSMHLPSKTVFANFPESEDVRFKNVSAAAISPNSGYLAVGNSSGRVLLWRLRHFANY